MVRRIVLLGLAMMILRVEPADACSCGPGGPPCADYWGAAAVFRGRVEAIDPETLAGQDPFPGKLVRFTVLEPFVGVDGPAITVWTAGSGPACGYRFTLNREYVVYAYKGKEGRLTTGTCTRTVPVERAAADLEFARNVRAGHPLGLIEVIVDLWIPPASSGNSTGSNVRPLPGVTVTLRRGEESFSGPTDRAGRLARSGLQPGTYEAEVKPPAGTRAYAAGPHSIELLDARGCAATEVALVPDGRIKGRVIDAGGGGVRGLTIGLRVAPTGASARTVPTSLQALTDADGRFEIADVPPGSFLLAAESADAGMVLFPGVADESKAERFPMRLGSRLTVKDFKLQVVTVTGVAVDAGRAPLEGARVYLRQPADSGAIVTLPVVTDWSGRFVISVPAGQEYVIFAERDRPGLTGRTDVSEPVRIGPRSPEQPLVLTLRPRY